MEKQLEFNFNSVRANPVRVKKVVIDELDRRERDRCANEGREFPDSLLLETRSQRMGISKSVFCHMQKWEQNLMLADEAVLLHYSTWEYEEYGRIDWELHEQRAKSIAEVWAKDFADFRSEKEQFRKWKQDSSKPSKSKSMHKRQQPWNQ